MTVMKQRISYFLLAGIFLLASCEDFLQEEFLSGENSESITSSEQTFETLINACYITLRAFYGKENGWDLTEAGTDLYTYGLDNRSQGFTTYQNFTGAEEQERMNALWRELYKGLNTCNLALRDIDEVPFSSEIVREQRRGEVAFLRAYYLWMITEIWGGVHFTTEPTQTAIHDANRTPVETFYDQIFTDLYTAKAGLPIEVGTADYGRITLPVAEAMLARTHLYREHYDSAAFYANRVINEYNYQLLDDWSQIWDIENIQNDEIIWSVNYSDNPVFTSAQFTDANGDIYNTAGLIQRDGGNTGHVMWEIRYENLSWGMVRDLENGRGFQRWGPTKFFLDLYDETVDERFYGSFKNVWYANSQTAIPKWRPFIFVDGERITLEREKWAEPMFEIGDTAIVFSKTPVPESEKARFSEDDLFYFHPEKGYIIIDINDMYLEDGSFNNSVINRQFYFPITRKYEDPTRPELTTQFSKRDAYVFRISEMYLIAAEAEIMRSNTGAALELINTLREARSVEGQEDAMRIEAGDLDLDFILDERARELATENQRFFDLKRTGTLVDRIRANNPDAAPFIQEFHGLRFIPQNQLDAMFNAEGYQNPGY